MATTPTRIEGDMHVNGALTSRQLGIPAGSVVNDSVSASAAIAATKMQHQYERTYAQPNAAATAVTQVIHCAYGATGSIVAFKAGSIAACIGNATITVDLRKNGTSVLAAPISLTSSNLPRVAASGTINTASFAAGDVLEVVTTVNAGTGTLGTGLFATATFREDAQ